MKPVAYAIPDDGPVGGLLSAAYRGPMRPAHVHFMVRAPGLSDADHARVRRRRSPPDSDAVFGVKRSLIGEFERHGRIRTHPLSATSEGRAQSSDAHVARRRETVADDCAADLGRVMDRILGLESAGSDAPPEAPATASAVMAG